MTYQQCGPLCPQTCDNLDQPCEGGCAEGCFCPFGEVLLGGMCVNNSQCEGWRIYTYTCAHNIIWLIKHFRYPKCHCCW